MTGIPDQIRNIITKHSRSRLITKHSPAMTIQPINTFGYRSKNERMKITKLLNLFHVPLPLCDIADYSIYTNNLSIHNNRHIRYCHLKPAAALANNCRLKILRFALLGHFKMNNHLVQIFRIDHFKMLSAQ
ncbi:hypothetical protein D3C76_868840 [compost metagenome]